MSHLIVPACVTGHVVVLVATRPVVPAAWRMLGLLGASWLAAGLAVLCFRRGRDWARHRGAAALAATVFLLGLLLAGESMLRYRRWGGWQRADPRGEIGHRFDHPTRGWANPPHARWVAKTREYENVIQTNSCGFRDVEHDLEAQPGVFRVVVLGDSFIEAAEVAFEESFVHRLEAQLSDRRVEVINLGVRVYGTAQQLLVLEEVGLAYRPDLVVLGFYLGNDTLNNSRWLQNHSWGPGNAYTVGRPYATIDPATGALIWTPPDLEQVARLARRSQRWLLLQRLPVPRFLRGRTRAPPTSDTWDENVDLVDFALSFDPSLGPKRISPEVYRARFDEAWAITLRLLKEIRRLSNGVGAPAVLMVIPSAFAVGERVLTKLDGTALRLDPLLPSRRFAETQGVHGMRLLDLVEPMRRANERGEGPFHFPEDGHWTADGHRFAADAMVEYLIRERLVPRRGGE